VLNEQAFDTVAEQWTDDRVRHDHGGAACFEGGPKVHPVQQAVADHDVVASGPELDLHDLTRPGR